MTKETLIDNLRTNVDNPGSLVFTHLPAFARFIKEKHLVPFVKEQLRISRELDIPMMKFIRGFSDDELLEMSVMSSTAFFTAAEDNGLKEHFGKAMEKWVSDSLGIMKKEELTAEDITMAGYVRKRALTKFLPEYTTDIYEAIEIINEIDQFSLYHATVATNMYINLLRDSLNEQTFFSEALSNTTPGLHYIYDLKQYSIQYANRNYLKFFGLTLPELRDMGSSVRKNLVHPDDVAFSGAQIEVCKMAGDDQMVSWEYRLKSANGNYVWMRNYAAVYKRDADGIASQLVGIVLDVSVEKETAEQLLIREKQLLDAQEQAQVGSFELDVETGKMQVTPQFKKIYELSDFDLYTLIDHVHPDDRDRINANRSKAIRDGSLYDNEYRYLINGKEKIIRSRGLASYKNGRLVLTGTAQDVTEKQKLIEQLQKSEQLYKQAQAISHIGNWAWDLQTKKLDWSDEIYRIYELEPQSLDNSFSLTNYNHPDDEQLVRDAIKTAVDSGAPLDFNYRIILKSGKVKTVHAKGQVSTDHKNSVVIYGTLQDITEQKAIERQLKDYKEFIEKITDVTPSIIAAYNIQTGQYSFVNDAVEKLLGYSTIKVMEEGVAFMASIVHPDDLAGVMEKNSIALDEANKMRHTEYEPISEFKYRMRNKNGQYRWFHTYGTIFERDESGLVESVLNISVDITEQETAEQALHMKNLQLQQSNTSLEEYAYVASHDLKEPLRKIATFGDRMLITQSALLTEEGKNYLNKIIDASRRMQNMVSDLLSVSTILGNTAYESCNLRTIFEEAIIPLEDKIEEKGAVIDIDDLPVVTVVASQFRQLFQNLVSNSLKFARKNVPSHIKITHKFLDYKSVDMSDLRKASRYLQITFEDNGIGFENEYANKIFAIFQRLHGKADYDGTGIGLAICKKVVENHGGTISARGIVNQSAAFTIIVPA